MIWNSEVLSESPKTASCQYGFLVIIRFQIYEYSLLLESNRCKETNKNEFKHTGLVLGTVLLGRIHTFITIPYSISTITKH